MKTRTVIYTDDEVWAKLGDIAPDRQLSRFVRFILADAVDKIERGDYQDELEEYTKQNFKMALKSSK